MYKILLLQHNTCSYQSIVVLCLSINAVPVCLHVVHFLAPVDTLTGPHLLWKRLFEL